MKALLLTAAATLFAGVASAQTTAPPVQLPRADAHVALGWQNLRKDQPQSSYNDWLNGIVYGGAGVGWYWTDHVKTQVDVGGGTRGSQYRYQQLVVNGSQTFESSRLRLRETNVTVGQQYQFFRNQWFHPHVGAGIEIARETATEAYDPVVVLDNVTHATRIVTPARVEGPSHRVFARAFGETGFKAYMTPRAFFVADMRLMFRGGIDEVLVRGGFGIDF
jgi:opacity protein-like surface antigen